MSTMDEADTEEPIRAAFAAGDPELAAQLTFARHGREILSFMRLRLRSDEHAQEAFSMFAEDLWSSMSSFGWRCSMRCWVHILARNAANRYASSPQRRPQRNLPLSQHACDLAVVEAERTSTKPYHQTVVKQRVRALRERLSNEDQQILVLHVDRSLSFRELALVMQAPADLDEEALAREAARLRKRFERIRAELRKLAIESGLFTD